MNTSAKQATVYRMVMPKHICPFGLKTVWLLRHEGFEVTDHWLKTRGAQEDFKAEHHVETTPQTFIDGVRVGGYDDVRRLLGKRVREPEATSYRPVLVLFAIAALLVFSFVRAAGAGWTAIPPRFIAIAMVLLALQKLQDLPSFATMFLGYDLLARRWVPYAYVYPFVEAGAGILMLARVLPWVAAGASFFIGSVGAASVIYAVYVQKRELRCACVGGNSNVPLGAISLSENLAMVAMAIWTTLTWVR